MPGRAPPLRLAARLNAGPPAAYDSAGAVACEFAGEEVCDWRSRTTHSWDSSEQQHTHQCNRLRVRSKRPAENAVLAYLPLSQEDKQRTYCLLTPSLPQ